MKVVLSKKGFDLQYGGKPSIIYPNKDMVSFPIPVDSEKEYGRSLDALQVNGSALSEFFKDLEIIKEDTNIDFLKYHLDPDIRYEMLKNRCTKNFQGSFGQSGAALGHLKNEGIGSGDLFLFYGTYSFTRLIDGKLIYAKSIPFHAIWGYLYVDEIIKDMNKIDERKDLEFLKDHPHYINRNRKGEYASNNYIYIGKKYGVFKYSETLRLSKIGYMKSYWSLPKFFCDIEMTYNKQKKLVDTSDGCCDFQIGTFKAQEFVFESNPECQKWIDKILNHNE